MSASAAEPRVYLFWGASCPHSQAARSFLLKQRERDPNLQLLELETEGSLINAVLLSKLFAKIGLPELTVVPTVVVGSSITIGYIDDAITGQEIMDTIASCRKDGSNSLWRNWTSPTRQSCPRGALRHAGRRSRWRACLNMSTRCTEALHGLRAKSKASVVGVTRAAANRRTTTWPSYVREVRDSPDEIDPCSHGRRRH